MRTTTRTIVMMTGKPMNYDTMPAGAEMDRLIAEKVMGWKCANSDGAVYVYSSGKIVRPTRWDCRDWIPSADISQAWEAVMRMTELGFAPTIGNHGEGHWWVTVTFRTGGRSQTCMGKNAPLAICRAALKAVGP